MITTRQALPSDASGMSALITPILESWNSERRRGPEHMLENYIRNPDDLRCTVAVDETAKLVGFQSLIRPDVRNPYGTPDGWGEIGTYVALDAGRGGIGRQLFAASLKAAQSSGLEKIEASIARTNVKAIAYYEAMGFRTHAVTPTLDRKCFVVTT